MSAINLVPAALGTFQTRANRLVRIRSTSTVQVPRPGGGTQDLPVFVGDLYKMDGRTVDSQHHWEKNGSFLNSRGVASDKDLCLVVKLDTPPAPETIADQGIHEDTLSKVSAAARDELGDIKTLVAPFAEGEESAYATIDRILHERENAKPADEAATTKRKKSARKAAAKKKK